MENLNPRRFKPKQKKDRKFLQSLGITADRSEAIKKGFGIIVYRKLRERARLSQNEFQEATHIPLSTIKRRVKKDERFSSQESDVIYRLAKLTEMATQMFAEEEQAQKWLRQGVYGLGGKRPLDMVSTTADFETVKDLIGRIEHGVFT